MASTREEHCTSLYSASLLVILQLLTTNIFLKIFDLKIYAINSFQVSFQNSSIVESLVSQVDISDESITLSCNITDSFHRGTNIREGQGNRSSNQEAHVSLRVAHYVT